jgi:hypothetical protein
MVVKLHRYWIRFAGSLGDERPIGTRLGCGVTARHRDDALALLQERVFGDQPLPEVREIIEDVDVSALDNRHVLPNMGNPAVLGIWFPIGYG